MSKEAYNYPWKSSKISHVKGKEECEEEGGKILFFLRESAEFGIGIRPGSATPTHTGVQFYNNSAELEYKAIPHRRSQSRRSKLKIIQDTTCECVCWFDAGRASTSQTYKSHPLNP